MGCLGIFSSSPQFLLFSLCACFLILHSFKFPPSVCGSFTVAARRGNETDEQALLAFKSAITSHPFGALNSWNHSVHFCRWIGVTCGRLHSQRVTELNLDHQKLEGSITPHIGNLSFLRVLLLRNNSLGSKIPAEIGRLRRLKILSVVNNFIGGEVLPVNISGCSNLVILELSFNNFEGKIPAEVGMLSKLERLYIHRNFKIAGSIPTSLANLSSLQVFYASENIIGGSIPNDLGRLSNLEAFLVGENKLVGTIPSSIWNISSMDIFHVAKNQIGGRLPSGLGGIIFPCLSGFHIFLNLFTGTIPGSISNASYMEELEMGDNQLTGDVPLMEKLVHLRYLSLENNLLGTAGEAHGSRFLSSLINASSLEILSISGNSFGGELPSSIGNLSSNSLKELELAGNELSGIIPHEVRHLISLERFDFRINKLRGTIPSTIGNLNKLRRLDIRDNDLTGIIPPSIGNLSNLLYLYMDRNNLHGTIPPSLGKCINLLDLHIHSNNLEGDIPRDIFSASPLLSLALNGNSLTGNLPIEVGTLVHLFELYISENMLLGELPDSLANCVQLKTLEIGSNNFSGILPPSLSSLKSLEICNLSQNNFSGEIPKYLKSFPLLQYLDLSVNGFEGEVPEQGVFKNITAFNVGGNIKLCGGISELHLPSCNSKLPEKKLRVKLIIGLAFGVTGAVMFLLFFYLYWFKKSRNLPSLRSTCYNLLNFSYQNLYEATDGFSEANLIGVGSFGSVYKGLLRQGQQTIAVKVLNLHHQGALKSFKSECEALRRIRHRNLLKVLTVCSSIDHQGNDFKALVYEYMPNGSLDDWLHSPESGDDTEADARNLDFCQRLEIVIGVASAVEYLHHHCEEPIVHCDLKPSNILLDSDMVAHFGDFGLAKFLQEGRSNHSSDYQSNTIGVRGSVGYVAPEYGMGNAVSTFGDVYSFGIIVLEMFTGKRPTDHHLFNGCLNLRDHVEMALPEQVDSVADPRLLLCYEDGDTKGSEKIEECLASLLRVGITCAQELPRDRMAINDAMVQLNAIKKALLGTGVGHTVGRATPPTGSSAQ